MKLVSPDRTCVYYCVDRPDGKSHGARIGRTDGARGFVSGVTSERMQHPAPFEVYDQQSARIPVQGKTLPPILLNVLGEIEDECPEIWDILHGRIAIEQILDE